MSADIGYDVQRPSLVFADFTKYTQQDLERWHKESDLSFGGASTCSWTLEKDDVHGQCAVLRGELVPRPRVLKQAMCMVDLRMGRPWDLVEQNALKVVMKSDGHPYTLNLRSPTTVEDDLFQGCLPSDVHGRPVDASPLPRGWFEATLPLDNLIHTSGGQERLVQVPFASRTVDSIGVGIVGSVHTRFELRVARLEAVYTQTAEREVEY